MNFNFPLSFTALRSAVLSLLALGLLSSRPLQPPPGDKPEENRFTKIVLAESLDEPMEMTFLNDGRILLIERKGALKAYNPATKAMTVIATIPVSTKYTAKDGRITEAEDGLLGIVADPNFAQNHWIYLYYSEPGDVAKNLLTRYELRGDELVMNSKKVLLEVATQREQCCHTGGGMVFDDRGNLFLTTGDNTSPRDTPFNPIDEREGRGPWDAQKSSGNTADLRGKIIRIHPETDGTYTIPDGNLFPKGTEKTRPEIYTMGHRNPWRISVDNKTGYIYWGEVGPDASNDSTGRGPRGFDEFNQAKGPGNFGWPYLIGNNSQYSYYDFAAAKAGEAYDPAHPVNRSPNNTGLNDLPPAQKALIWYPYSNSAEFPMMGRSGRSATGGPIFHKSDFTNAKRTFPSYYEGKWFIVEFMRGWIMTVTLDEQGNYKSMEQFLPNENFSSAIDMKFSPDGDLYVLEYGSAWFRGNDNARIVKIEYNGGNRPPLVQASATKTGGAIPFDVAFSANGTKDYDGDALKYSWKVTSKAGPAKMFTQPNPMVTFDKPGIYQATLLVTDAKGAKSSKSIEIKAGNEPPLVAFDVKKGNKSFFFPNQPIDYAVRVNDKEDGSLANGKIAPTQVAVSMDYLPEGFDPIEVAQNHRGTETVARYATGQQLISQNDCKSCHMIDKKSVGPSYIDVAKKYKSDPAAVDRLAKKVISGGGGVWGDHSMSAHPQLTTSDATAMVNYVMSLGEKPVAAKTYPVQGSFSPKVPEGENGKGGFALRASYTDRGTKLMKPVSSESVVILRNPDVLPENADLKKGTQFTITPSKSFLVIGNDSYIGYNQLDLTDIGQIDLLVQATSRVGAVGGNIEVRLDSPTGPLVGKTTVVKVSNPAFPGAAPASTQRPTSTSATGAATPPTSTSVTAPAGGTPDRAAMMRRMSQKMTATITPTTGMHTIFFVFKNPQATADQVLMQVVTIQFMPAGQTASTGTGH
ncbi:PQQ-dependent sugar dehydrogenase [Spirosoma flavum]|uniref:PQQ-dependent sugar dehydrogenase n=1 Tax=Spirosoma flavum TaxID=2048557 RepID=A0ABW6AFV9_9BACT